MYLQTAVHLHRVIAIVSSRRSYSSKTRGVDQEIGCGACSTKWRDAATRLWIRWARTAPVTQSGLIIPIITTVWKQGCYLPSFKQQKMLQQFCLVLHLVINSSRLQEDTDLESERWAEKWNEITSTFIHLFKKKFTPNESKDWHRILSKIHMMNTDNIVIVLLTS
jgi:hypothetical protein